MKPPDQRSSTRDPPLRSHSPRLGLQTETWVAIAFAVGLATLLIATWIAYHPGIHGVFLLDDFSNLSALGATGGVTDWEAFWRYITSGTADPTGRPLSLLAFLVDANGWPANATPFKITNILLHLLNGVLLCWAMLKLALLRHTPQKAAALAALIGTGFWLLHPLLVSTTLYIVQREAMLATTFTIAGFICWCTGRNAFENGRPLRAIAWMAAAVWGCTLLATLCKSNGVLLPVLIVVAEVTVLRLPGREATCNRRLRRTTTVALLGIPIALLLAYFAIILPGLIRATPGIRGWTIGQRLLTEPRVLVDYLRLLWIPSTTSFGIFTDQIQASANIRQPWTTLPCIVFVIGLIGTGWLVRQRHPAIAFAILFYFAGQLLESSIVPLQLAFEHRNYLPAAFMFWPLGLWVASLGTRPALARGLTVLVLCVLACMTWVRAGVWGDLPLQARLWGRLYPESPQAQSFSATVEADSGEIAAAVARLRDATLRMPDQPQVALTLIDVECQEGTIQTQSWRLAMESLRTARTGWNNIANWFITTVPRATSSVPCHGLTMDHLTEAYAALKSNPSFMKWHSTDPAFARVDAVLDLANGEPQRAIAAFDVALAATPGPRALVEQAKALQAYGYPKVALQRLDLHGALAHATWGTGMPRLHAWVMYKQGWWQKEITRLRHSLAQGTASKAAVGVSRQ